MKKRPPSKKEAEAAAALAEELSQFYADPLGFVLFAYPWGEPGTELEKQTGPDRNQERFLIDLGDEVKKRGFDGRQAVMPIQMTITSGHGTGKTELGAWIANWIMSTRPDSKGKVTAGTWQQLKDVTWSRIRHWTGLCITRDWWDIQAQGIYHRQRPEVWKCTPQTCKEQNAQAFAGQHAQNSTSWYIFDEASLIPEKVWEVAKGGLSDGEPMWFAWGQPEKNSGHFHKINFGRLKYRWNHRRFDSRSSRWANQELTQQYIEDYGEDSDMFRVRVLGLHPLADELQHIDTPRIEAAQAREAMSLEDDPLICGVDVSGGGSAWTVCAFRRGLDARSIPRVRINGEQSKNRAVIVTKLAEILRDERPGRKVAAMFIDMAFGSPIYERLRALGFKNVFETNFGDTHTPEPKRYLNMRAYMWDQMKDWLPRGALPTDDKIAVDLAGPGAERRRDGKLVLESKQEMKARNVASPDDGDALALTFAQPVAPVEKEDQQQDEEEECAGTRIGGWMGR